MRYLIFSSVLLLFAPGASAQEDLLACVDPDVRAGLLPGMTEETTLVSRDFPEFLSELAPSDDLEFIGSSVAPFETIAAYKTGLATADAFDAAAGLLRDAGWRVLEIEAPLGGGFVTGVQPLPQFGTFCQDGQNMHVIAAEVEGTTYVRLLLWPDAGPGPCEEMPGGVDSFGFGPTGESDLYQHMPTLVLPEQATVLNPYGGYIIGAGEFPGTGRSIGTEVELETDLSAQAMVEHYGQQLDDQGWRRDTGWSGEYSSGSAWTRSPDAGLELAGLLDIVALAGSGYRASFRISLRDSE
ncbi:MAG: hypothetical protein OXI73_06645 [Rhodospirillales bacterium]|nr:hypothetical protein [Rhodospirillales bacterium]